MAALARVRSTDKPMHPRGTVHRGTLRRTGVADPVAGSGSPFLDTAGVDPVVVRVSRSVGLPRPWPDVNGLAIRVPTPDGPADLLLNGTGRGRLGRFVLAPSTRGVGRFCTTLLPLASPSGPVLVAAEPVGPLAWRLLWAPAWSRASAWRVFGRLELAPAEEAEDVDVTFDPAAGAPPGLTVPAWQRELRAPSYAAARRARGA